ncbi:MAG: TonB-dependent receptor [Alphaproteobacteria bacterium]|nr:TonB-dependent receptor [Alphaproteobacteria bacterium]MBU1515199.1 TonB-dependent receptor [Alphaproteobacteria bacterium]MBU2092329.1 TonB-dependent receptor [Alphaproteobacteria bacterium]MBU2152923.1 TonB-dependent receptor [Alphaproteobacteria bacterium]MBU2305754.1 TonB-dependent receptor [Alphaproteobacteria bacterium]
MGLRRVRAVELMCGGAVSLLALSGPAFAQTGGDQAELSEIIVTAQKRSENLQDVPISIQALSQEKIERLNAKDFVDVARHLPSVSIRSIVPGVGNIFMRGISSGPDGGASGSLPSVGVYLDEQPVTTIQGTLDIQMFDIARVEALAGPQGTLYGASSQSGTLRIITNKPEPGVTRGRVDVETNATFKGGVGYSIAGMINVPIAERVTLRAVAWNRLDPGYIDNVQATRTYPVSRVTIDNSALAEKNFNDVEVSGARAALRVDLDDNWTITPGLMIQKTKAQGNTYQILGGADLEVERFFPDKRDDTYWQAAMTIQGKVGDLDVTYAGAYLNRKFDTQFDYSDYSFFYDTLFGMGQIIVNNAGVPIDPSQRTRSNSLYTRDSHELRVATPQDKRLRVSGGLFYQSQRHELQSQYIIQGLATAISVTGWPNTQWLTDQQRTDRDYAAFGEVSFDILPSLTLTAGGRAFKATSHLVGFAGLRGNERGCFAPTRYGAGPCTNVDRKAKGDGFSPRLNATWKVDDNKLLYVTYSEGFRPGGINRAATSAAYEPDYLKNYEAGWKTTWADGKLRVNGAVFDDRWDGFQMLVQTTANIAEVRNVGQARVRGVEGDFAAVLGGGFSITGAASYIDAKLLENYCGRIDANGDPITVCATPIAPAGARLPLSAKFKGSLSIRYDWSMGGGDMFVEATGAQQGSSWSSLRTRDRFFQGKSPGFETVDLSAGAIWDNWRLTAYARNLFDSRGELARLTSCPASVCSRIYQVPIRPRNVGVKVSRDF